MKIVKTKTLYFKKGTSDKVYKLHLTNDSPHPLCNCGVMVEYGRRGAKLTRHVPMPPYAARYHAEEKFDKLLKEKLGKGYTEHEPLTLTLADVGKKFKTRSGRTVTLERIEGAGRFRFDDGYWRESDGWFGFRDRDKVPYSEDIVERLPEELPVKLTVTKPACLKTRLRKREIGRKFRTRGGLTVTLERRHAWLPGTWVWKDSNGNLFNCEADGRIHSGNGEGSLDLVERLPVEKKPAPKTEHKFKVGDRVKIVRYMSCGIGRGSVGQIVTVCGFDDFQWSDGTTGSVKYTCDDGEKNALPTHCFDKVESKDEPKFKVGDRVKNPTVERYGVKGVSAKVVEVTNDILKVQFDRDKYASSVNWADKTMYYRNEDIAAWQKVNVRPYPDYKKMKAALEDIRDNSPIGSDAALKAKAGLEGVEC